MAEQFEQSPSLSEDEVAGDYVPHLPSRDEVPDALADAVLSFVANVSADGGIPRRAARWPGDRWFPRNQCHAGLTVIGFELGGPPSVVVANDVAHLPADLRWTGVPEHLRL